MRREAEVAITAEWVTAYLGLGSNLGDRLEMLRRAVEGIGRLTGVRVDLEEGVGPVYETVPVGTGDTSRLFLNTAVRVYTSLGPHALLAGVLGVETALGRVRGRRWDDRTIDIDLLLYGDLVVDDERLTLPHRGLAVRRFVLEPLSAIAGDVVHPVCGMSIAELARAARAADRDGDMVVYAAAGEGGIAECGRNAETAKSRNERQQATGKARGVRREARGDGGIAECGRNAETAKSRKVKTSKRKNEGRGGR